MIDILGFVTYQLNVAYAEPIPEMTANEWRHTYPVANLSGKLLSMCLVERN